MTKSKFLWLLLISVLILPGCSTLSYYHQAAMGQFSLLAGRAPLETVLADETVPELIRQKLQLARQITRFAETEVGLDVGDTFSTYVDINRPYLVWNVFVAEEFSTQLKTHCYPIAGCVGYKGFFAQKDAESFAKQQVSKGYDVYVGGVAAYSTLGWFSDPLVSTFMGRSEADLADLIFHELAHKSVYVKGDTVFNESFATAVSRYALALWLDKGEKFESHIASAERSNAVVSLILDSRNRLSLIYSSDSAGAIMGQKKSAELARLREAYAELRQTWGKGREFSYWMQTDINNAKMAAIGAYQDLVPGFEVMLEQAASYDNFVEKVIALSKFNQSERTQFLTDLPSRGH